MQVDLTEPELETINFKVQHEVMQKVRELAFRERTTVTRQLHVALCRLVGTDPGIVQPRIPSRLLERARTLDADFPSPTEFDAREAALSLACSLDSAKDTLCQLNGLLILTCRLDTNSRRKRVLYRRDTDVESHE
jgi:hypothetical protein